MSQGDDGGPARPPIPKKPPALPRPGTPGAKPPPPLKPPPPVPTTAKVTPPPVREDNPFLPPESSREVDAGWLAPDDAGEALSLAPEPDEAADDPIVVPAPRPPPIIAAPPPPPPPPIVEVDVAEPMPIAAGDAEPAKPETPVSLPPPPKRSRAKVIALVLVPVLLVVGGGLLYQNQMAARSAKIERPQASVETKPIEPPPPTSEPPPPPTHKVDEPAPSASVAKKPAASGGAAAPILSADPSKTGILDTTALPPGRKIIVDGRFVGSSPRRVVVHCGMRRIQIGDLPPESLHLPCGGEISFTD